MEKIKNAIILIIEIVLAVSIISFAAIYIGASGTESLYQKSAAQMNKGAWIEALDTIERIPHYKDSSQLYVYIYGNSIYYKHYKTMDEELTGYRIAEKYIADNYKTLSIQKYKDGFNELNKVLAFKIEELSVEKQYDSVISLLNDGVNMIKKGDLIGASAKLNSISTDIGNANAIESERKELLAYIEFLNAVNLNDAKAVMKSIGSLDPNYSGVLKDEISNAVQASVDINKWYSTYSGDLSSKSIQISLGMKREDVISTLGNPGEDFIIKNVYGDFEKMAYDKRELYFEKNMLNTIKE